MPSYTAGEEQERTYLPEINLINIYSFSTNIPIASIPLILIQTSDLDCWHFVISILKKLPAVYPNSPCEIWKDFGKLDSRSYKLKTLGVVYSGLPLQDILLMPRVPELTFAPSPSGELWCEYLQEGSDEMSFCDVLIGRDHRCLVSEVPWDECIPTLILPRSRIDVFMKVRGYFATPDPYEMLHMSMGVILRVDLSEAFGRYEWSFYRHEGYSSVHFFDPLHPQCDAFHGKSFNLTRFDSILPNTRIPHKCEVPNNKVLDWHYQQGVQVFAEAAQGIPAYNGERRV